MDKKPKTRSAPRKAKTQKLEDKEQSERFVASARMLGVDDDDSNLEIVVRHIAKRLIKRKDDA